MPQMAPINWFILFILFSISFILFSMMNYYSFMPTTPNSITKKINQKYFYWKW
uniref:ATP synthase complex subunit 8 n=1 Tax=Phaonia fuscata TaxID=2719084 RepID=A0A7G7CDL2_9MUSC|nr:ATP synthase F0 subunit 8 [Phaonia fuscata]